MQIETMRRWAKNTAERVGSLADEQTRLFDSPVWVVYSGIGLFLVTIADTVNRYAGLHATRMSLLNAPLTDPLLGIIPKMNTSFVHLGAWGVLVALALLLVFFIPKRLPVVFLAVASIVLVRSVFINMTNLGMYADAERIFGVGTTFGGDLFFSGHVAIPFILGMVFWEYRKIRVFFFACAFVLGAESIAGHYHYSIDVFAAPFIAYGVYRALIVSLPRLTAVSR